jgi:hypothetical protein
MRFPFAFAPAYRAPALLFGVLPSTAHVDADTGLLRVRFGPWVLRTPWDNIESTTVTGGYAFLKTAGPPHLSFTDHGVTFATNGERGLCLRFHEPVRSLDPSGRFLQHPGATVTVADPEGLADAVRV